jgi:hypothetical protein
MKKGLYIDVLSPIGHNKFNNLTTKTLKKKYSLITIARKNSFEKVDIAIPEKYFKEYKKLKYILNEINKLNWIIKKIKEIKNYDFIIFSSFDNISFFLKSNLLSKISNRIYIFNHNNIDAIRNSKIKKYLYKKINLNVTHFVFEEYFKDYLKKIGIKNQIITVPHLVERKNLNVKKKDFQILKIFIPSNNYEFDYITKLIKTSNNSFFTIKSNYNFNNKNVKSKSFFDNYEKIFSNHDIILLPLKVQYDYRVSNIINESFSFSKPCFCFRNKLTRYLNEKYPNMILLIDNNSTFKEIYKKYKLINFDKLKDEREIFLKRHSSDLFLRKIKDVFKGDV